ncbi:MAG: DUF362 domain-containing protein [Verrucomicrobiota bacterium]|jgi:uncharacterized protein (DUF362 family)/Pyruvate/2-oxoacid:ferredoxin oxidoreductase delta subunit|nr:DUF362 domain-containing protein [Verrucomicrobiota bacterium]
MKNEVYVAACADYGPALPPALDRLLDMAGWPDGARLAGRRVLVKPNLLTDRAPEQAVTTHPEVVRQVVRRLKAAGARVTVGDSPASAANIQSVWARSGIGAVCAEEGVPLIALEQAGAQTFERDGFTFSVARPVLEADLLVNLPKVKSHSLTLLTAAVKNIYGAVPGYAKTTLHRLYPKPEVFGRLVKTLWQVMPPSWSIADAVTGMEGQGPANGRPVHLGFLAASEDPFALDRALCGILHIAPRRVPYLAAQAEADQTPPAVSGDRVAVASFDIPSGAHLLRLLPDWLVRNAARIIWVRPAFSAAACVRCGLCVKACPMQALALPDAAPAPVLDGPRCISCSCCHEVCPRDAIRMTQSRVLRAMKVFKGLD